jgi:hypothetical protein
LNFLDIYESLDMPVWILLVASLFPASAQESETTLLTADRLPALFRDAITALNAELPGHASLAPPDVVVVTDVNRFAQQFHLDAEKTRQLSEEIRMFVAGNRPPIYVLAGLPDMVEALSLYQHGKASYLRYTFAAMLGHEWVHAFLHDHSESRAYAFEAELLIRFWDRGVLPKECAPDIVTSTRRLLEALQTEAASGTDQSVRLLQKWQ